MNESPVIGITVSIDHGKIIRKNHDYLYVKKAYSETVKKAGGQPILISPDLTAEVAAEICDAIIISGGDDIPPSLYGEPVEAEINQESAERIRWERRVLDLFVQSESPLLGVCYGMQLINVHFGGSLYQDLHAGFENALDHGGLGKATSHRVTIVNTCGYSRCSATRRRSAPLTIKPSKNSRLDSAQPPYLKTG